MNKKEFLKILNNCVIFDENNRNLLYNYDEKLIRKVKLNKIDNINEKNITDFLDEKKIIFEKHIKNKIFYIRYDIWEKFQINIIK